MSLVNHILPEERRVKLKQKINRGEKVKCIEVHSGLSALICSQSQRVIPGNRPERFDALWISSLTGSASKGLPDMEIYLLERRLELIEEVCQVTKLPIIVDGDTGGDPTGFEYFCTKLEALGVSAVVIEDKKHPKRNSLSEDSAHVLEDPILFAGKIQRAKKALQSDAFMIFARIESLIAGESIEDALSRANIYLKYGADGIMIHSKSNHGKDITEFLSRFQASKNNIPIICVPTTYNFIYDKELFRLGASIVIHANHTLRAAHKAIEKICEVILENDRSYEADELCTPVKEIFSMVGYDAALVRERSLYKPLGKNKYSIKTA